MELGKEIKQASFKSEYTKAILNIVFTGNWLMSNMIHILKPYDLSPQQYNVLRILRGRYPTAASLSEIQERMLDRMSNATRLVEKLKQKKYLTRIEVASNRRKVAICITRAGLDLLSSIESKVESLEKELNTKIIIEDIIELNRVLDKVRDRDEK